MQSSAEMIWKKGDGALIALVEDVVQLLGVGHVTLQAGVGDSSGKRLS